MNIEIFNKHYHIKEATSAEDINKVKQIVHDTYVMDRGYDPKTIEDNSDDLISQHFLIINNRTDICVASCRITLPDYTNDFMFPVEKYYTKMIGKQLDVPSNISKYNILELGRMSVSRKAISALKNEATEEERQASMYFIHNMFAIALGCASDVGIEYIIGCLESKAIKLCSRLGVDYIAVGEPMLLSGTRTPVLANVENTIRQTEEANHDIGSILNSRVFHYKQLDK